MRSLRRNIAQYPKAWMFGNATVLGLLGWYLLEVPFWITYGVFLAGSLWEKFQVKMYFDHLYYKLFTERIGLEDWAEPYIDDEEDPLQRPSL